IEPGEHHLSSKIDWCGSKTLTFRLSDQESKRVELSGFKLGKFILPTVLILSILFFAFGKELNFNPMLYIGLMLGIGSYLFYFLTFGSNNYLRLRAV
ncbi:MAG: hypothetical protein AAFU64_19000, partial [Bacteroidota bacterium]